MDLRWNLHLFSMLIIPYTHHIKHNSKNKSMKNVNLPSPTLSMTITTNVSLASVKQYSIKTKGSCFSKTVFYKGSCFSKTVFYKGSCFSKTVFYKGSCFSKTVFYKQYSIKGIASAKQYSIKAKGSCFSKIVFHKG